jgi:hypothetical protein
VFAFAPPVGFCDVLGLGCPQWVFHLGTHTLAKVVRLGDLVYADCNGFYAGGAIINEAAPPNNPLPGYCHLVVKGAWVDCSTDADGAHFCVLVPTHFYSPVHVQTTARSGSLVSTTILMLIHASKRVRTRVLSIITC